MRASTLPVFFLEAAIAFVWAGFERTVSYHRLSRMNLNTSYQTGDDSMTHLASHGVWTNFLRIGNGVFFILRLEMTLPLESWISTWKVFL